jgi:hypothetical protein
MRDIFLKKDIQVMKSIMGKIIITKEKKDIMAEKVIIQRMEKEKEKDIVAEKDIIVEKDKDIIMAKDKNIIVEKDRDIIVEKGKDIVMMEVLISKIISLNNLN